jgi:hypothetical protein
LRGVEWNSTKTELEKANVSLRLLLPKGNPWTKSKNQQKQLKRIPAPLVFAKGAGFYSLISQRFLYSYPPQCTADDALFLYKF